MKLSELDYALPQELIAQRPLERRDDSRLLVYDRGRGEVRQRRFSELADELEPDELVVVNDTRVIPARIRIEQPRGEVLLLERRGEDGLWEGLARPTKRLRAGRRYGPVELLEHLGEGRWLLRLDGEPSGEMPFAAVHHRRRSPTRSATRPSTLRRRAQQRLLRPGSISPRGCWRDSTSSG
jgi:S-adenosylmethionine:tRNA-ribosyltransferase-isomerase (queuine synthetase)